MPEKKSVHVTWMSHQMKVCRYTTDWRDIAGVYIFAGVVNGKWKAFYVGQTESFKDRMADHERWDEAVGLGATHVHARVIEDEARRGSAEAALIEAYRPPLNTQLM